MSNPATAVAAAPFVAAIEPYLVDLATLIVGGAVTLAAAAIHKWTGVAVSSTAVEAVRRAAATEAGKLVAAAADNLAARQINVESLLVKQASDALAERLPDLLKSAGITPDALDHLVAGEIGKLQAQMTSAPAASPSSDHIKEQRR